MCLQLDALLREALGSANNRPAESAGHRLVLHRQTPRQPHSLTGFSRAWGSRAGLKQAVVTTLQGVPWDETTWMGLAKVNRLDLDGGMRLSEQSVAVLEAMRNNLTLPSDEDPHAPATLLVHLAHPHTVSRVCLFVSRRDVWCTGVSRNTLFSNCARLWPSQPQLEIKQSPSQTAYWASGRSGELRVGFEHFGGCQDSGFTVWNYVFA